MAKGSVIKRSGSWYAVYRDGSRQKWEKVGTSKRSAEKVLAQRLDQLNSGDYQELTQIRFAEFAEKWLRDYAGCPIRSLWDEIRVATWAFPKPSFSDFTAAAGNRHRCSGNKSPPPRADGAPGNSIAVFTED